MLFVVQAGVQFHAYKKWIYFFTESEHKAWNRFNFVMLVIGLLALLLPPQTPMAWEMLQCVRVVKSKN